MADVERAERAVQMREADLDMAKGGLINTGLPLAAVVVAIAVGRARLRKARGAAALARMEQHDAQQRADLEGPRFEVDSAGETTDLAEGRDPELEGPEPDAETERWDGDDN